MGKRELLLIIAFIAAGAVVYHLTAPAGQTGDSVVEAGHRIIDEIRQELRGRPASAEITRTDTHPVPSGIREVRVTIRNQPVTVTGEERLDIASDLWVNSNGIDEAEARNLAERAELTVEATGPTMMVSLKFPREGTQHARLHLRVPREMLVQFGPTNNRIEITGVRGVELEAARGETIIRKIQGRVAVAHRGGEFTVEDVGSVRLATRGSDLRLTGVHGEAALELVSGDVRARRLLGPVEIDSEHADVTLDSLEDAKGPLRIKSTDGLLVVRGLRTEAHIEASDTEIEVVMDRPAAVAIFNTDDRIQFTLPAAGFTLDAVAIGGEIRVPDGLTSQIAHSSKADGDEKEQRASGAVGGGGPTITLRATGGDIHLNQRTSE